MYENSEWRETRKKRRTDTPVGSHHWDWRTDSGISDPEPKKDPERVSGGPKPESTAERFAERFKECIADFDPKSGTTVTQAFQGWLDTLGKVADGVLGKPTRKRQMPKYVDKEVWETITQRRRLWSKVRDAVNRGESAEKREQIWKDYCVSVQQGKALMRRKRADSWSSYCEKLNQ
jgi:hypothetical protein